MTEPAGRVLHATLDLLDRQLRDRDAVLCGNVDDLELRRDDDGRLYVTHLVAGGGALALRLGWRRLGRRLHARSIARQGDADHDRTMIPIVAARSIGPAIDLSVDAADLATDDLERWARDHVIDHIPLAGRRARE